MIFIIIGILDFIDGSGDPGSIPGDVSNVLNNIQNEFYFFIYSLNAYLSLNHTATHNETHVFSNLHQTPPRSSNNVRGARGQECLCGNWSR